MGGKYRVKTNREKGNYRSGVEQNIGNRTWTPLTGTFGTFSTEEQVNRHEINLKKSYEWYLTDYCVECDTMIDDKNQRKCHFCGAKLPEKPVVVEQKPSVIETVEVKPGFVPIPSPPNMTAKRGRPKRG